MNAQALNNNLVVEIYAPINKTSGGIIIPDMAVESQDKGIVVSVGEEVKDKNIKVGTTVYSVKGSMDKTPFELDGKTYFIIKDYDLLMLVQNEN